jgi:hypothetical protein
MFFIFQIVKQPQPREEDRRVEDMSGTPAVQRQQQPALRSHSPEAEFVRSIQRIPDGQLYAMGTNRQELTRFAEDLAQRVRTHNEEQPMNRIGSSEMRMAFRSITEYLSTGEPTELVSSRPGMLHLRHELYPALRNTGLGMFEERPDRSEERRGVVSVLVFSSKWEQELRTRIDTGLLQGSLSVMTNDEDEIARAQRNPPREIMEQIIERMNRARADGDMGLFNRARDALGLQYQRGVVTYTQMENARNVLGIQLRE